MKTILASSLYGPQFEPQLVQGLQSGRITKLLVVMEKQPPKEATEVFAWFRPKNIPEDRCAEQGCYFRSPQGLNFLCEFLYQPGDVIGIKESVITLPENSRFENMTFPDDFDEYFIRLRPVVQEIGVVQVSKIEDDVAYECIWNNPSDNLIRIWRSQHPAKDWAWVLTVGKKQESP